MRIFIGLTEVSGYFARLQSGFEELGVEAVHISLQAHRFVYSEESSMPRFARWARWTVSKRALATQASRLLGILWLPPVFATRLLLFIWAALRYDVFIMGAGSSFFGLRELPVLRLLGKTVIYTLHGTDARPPYIDGFFDPVHYGLQSLGSSDIDPDPHCRAKRLAEAHAVVTARRRDLVRKVERHANYVLCYPSYAQFLSRPFVDFSAVGLPTALPCGFRPPSFPRGENGTVRVLHAPSQVAGKGTAQIRAIIAELQAQGLPIEYVEVSGRPNVEVFEEIAQSDFVVDQYYSDTPMAAFAAEAGRLGKPAVIGGFFSAILKDEISPLFQPPSAFCLPEQIGDTIARLVHNQEGRRQLGIDAKTFVAQRWTPACVAKRFLRLIDNDVPPEWITNPACLRYLHGIGLSEDQVRANLAVLIDRYGIEALGLGHKPALQDLFISFARHPSTNA